MSNLQSVPDFELSTESKHVIKGILESKTFDTGGVLDIDELGECLEAFGFNADEEDVAFLQKHFDDNGDGELEVHELMDNIDVLNWHSFYGKELMREFTRIDNDGDGVIRFPEMLKVLTTKGPNPLPPKEARQLLDTLARKFDANFDGKFSYAEFVKIYMSDLLPYRNTLGQYKETDSEEEKQEEAAAKKEAMKKKRRLKKKPSNGEVTLPEPEPETSCKPLPGYMRATASAVRKRPSTKNPVIHSTGASRRPLTSKTSSSRLTSAKTTSERKSTYQ